MKPIRFSLITLLAAGFFPQAAAAQELSTEVRAAIGRLLDDAARKEISIGRITIDSVAAEGRTLTLFANMNCSYIPFREDNVSGIYEGVKALLPAEFAGYDLRICTDRHAIEELIPLPSAVKRRRRKPARLPTR